MIYLEIALFVLGVVLLIVGYRKNRRGLLLTAAIVLFLSAAGGPLFTGFVKGIHDGIVQSATP